MCSFASTPLPQSPVPAPHKNNSSCVGFYIHSSLKNHRQHRARPCLCTDQLPTVDACSSQHNLSLWFHGLQAQVPTAFLWWWWMMVAQTQHILPMAHGWDMERWKNYTARNLGSCSSFLRAVVRLGHRGDSLSLLPTHIGKVWEPLGAYCFTWKQCRDTLGQLPGKLCKYRTEYIPITGGMHVTTWVTSIPHWRKKTKHCEQTFAEQLIRHCMEIAAVPRHLLSLMYRFSGILWYVWQKCMPQIYISVF